MVCRRCHQHFPGGQHIAVRSGTDSEQWRLDHRMHHAQQRADRRHTVRANLSVTLGLQLY
jgi:hypothetical protein